MKLRLTLRAEADIGRIASYIHTRNPQGARKIEEAMQAAFRLIAAYSHVGRSRRHGVRRFALPQYPYPIFYGVDEAAQQIDVFTIRYAARREEN